MQNIPQETQDAFQKENGMTIEEAIKHIEKWIEEKNFESADAGISEIKKFVTSLPEIGDLEIKLREKKSKSAQEKSDKETKEIESVADSNLEEVTKSEKFISAIGYFGFLCALPLAMKPNSEFCKWHGKQALFLAIFFTLMTSISVIMPGGLGLMSVFHIIVSVIGFMQANKGNLWNLPIFGDAARKLPI